MRVLRLVPVVGALLYVGTALFERVSPVRWVRAYQRATNRVQRPFMGWLPGWCVVETRGRKTGLVRRNPVGCRRSGDTLWVVAGDGPRSSFVRNLEADPRVRVKRMGRWHAGTATPAPDEDPLHHLLRTNPVNTLFVLLSSRRDRMLPIRIDLDR